MTTLNAVLRGIVVFGNVWMTLLLAYYIYLSLYGFRRETRTYDSQEPQARFLILVPAHNEEAVIGDMVRNLDNLAYPRHLYDYYIIADNCEDDTAVIARAMGAKVIENHKPGNDSPTGKPIALRNALAGIPGYADRYDLLMIFDADNQMDANILAEVNSQYISENRPEIIQCYLGSKNRAGLVALFYHVTYTVTNRFNNLSKYRLGLNAAVGGTGFAIQTAYLKKRGGWTTMSLTEDFEMQVDVTVSGGRILWNHNVRIYDEKPTNLYASLRQRIRWSQGHWFVALKNTPRLIGAWVRRRISFGEMLSLLTYMYSMAAPVFLAVMLVAALLQAVTPLTYGGQLARAMAAAQVAMEAGAARPTLWTQLPFVLSSVAMMAYSTFYQFWYAEKEDNGRTMRLRDVPYILVSYLVNLVNVSLAQLVGLFKHRQQDKWVKTRHKITTADRQAVGESKRA